MWRLKSCPKCGGDIFIDRDMENNWYAQCLQCAYQRELRDMSGFEIFTRVAHEKKKEAVAAKTEGK